LAKDERETLTEDGWEALAEDGWEALAEDEREALSEDEGKTQAEDERETLSEDEWETQGIDKPAGGAAVAYLSSTTWGIPWIAKSVGSHQAHQGMMGKIGGAFLVSVDGYQSLSYNYQVVRRSY
jgi:hypothetical protein